MSIKRIYAILLQELFITLRSVEIIFDVFVFSIVNLLLFGFLSLYLAGAQSKEVAQFLLLGMLLWEIIRITQYSISVGSLWNIWSRNLSNMFISPIRVSEYICAHTASGIIKTLLVFIINSIITIYIFHFNIFQLGALSLVLFFINLLLFSFSTGIFILGLIFKFGTRIQAFAWGIIPILQPLTAAFFPVDILPQPVRSFAYLFPNTYVFEAARFTLVHQTMDWNQLAIAFSINILYLIIAVLFFKLMFHQSRNSGQFARNEG
jgi:ABC-2 type transport system permease protein